MLRSHCLNQDAQDGGAVGNIEGLDGQVGLHVYRHYVGVSKNSGKTPKSSILIGFSIINHPFWGTPIFGNTHVYFQIKCFVLLTPGMNQIEEHIFKHIFKWNRQILRMDGISNARNWKELELEKVEFVAFSHLGGETKTHKNT